MARGACRRAPRPGRQPAGRRRASPSVERGAVRSARARATRAEPRTAADEPPAAKERLSRDLRRRRLRARTGPAYGRDEPSYGGSHAADADPACAGDPRGRRRRRRRQRDQPHGRCRDPRGRVHGGQHRPSVAAAVERGRHRPPRQRRCPRPRRRLQPRARLPRGVRGAGQDQAPAQGLGHGLRHLRRRRRHRDRCGSGDRAARARRRRAHGRHRHEAVSLRGHAPRRARPTRGSRRSAPRSTR